MARSNGRGLELSFHKATSRWLKIIDGEKVYFGSGKGVSDRDSYREALGKFRTFMDRKEAVNEVRSKSERVSDAMVRSMSGDHNPDWGGSVKSLSTEELQDLVADAAMPEGLAAALDFNAAKPVAGSDITTLTDAYLKVQQNRRDLTITSPDALPRKRRLSPTSYRGLKYCVESFRDYATDQARMKTFADAAQLERLLLGYRQHLEDRMLSAEISPSTVNARVVYLTPLFTALWKSRHITELPRCLDEVCKKYAPRPKAKPLPLESVRKLWAKADGRMRAFIALGLNCGMYAMELATVKGAHIVDGYLCKHRNKTGVPYRHKLWPITLELIKAHRDRTGGEELLFITKQGFPLVHEGPSGKSDSVSQAFRKVATEANVEATWCQLRDTSATQIEKLATTGRGQTDKGVVSMFLAHADGRTARFYVEQDPLLLPTKKLDAALDKLAGIYGLVSGPSA